MIRKFYLTSCFIVSFFLFPQSNFAQAPTVVFQKIAEALYGAVDVVNAGDGSNRLFVVQKDGVIRIVKNGLLTPAPFLLLPNTVINTENENGILSVAFHPDYATNGYFFAYYIDTAKKITLARFKVSAANADSADESSRVVLMSFQDEYHEHVGCKLNFGADGYLYFAIGDGGPGGDPNHTAQATDTLLGKMLRIDVNNFDTPPYYSIPADNPFVDSIGYKKEIWSLGLRNPWRWSFDRETHDMWIGDVGEAAREEINFNAAGATKGLNYGWSCYEGDTVYNTTTNTCLDKSNYVEPIFSCNRDPLTGARSITGGYVYRGNAYPFLKGYYICVDFLYKNGWLIKPAGGNTWDIHLQKNWPGFIVGFGEDEAGELYAVDIATGSLYKLLAMQTVYTFTGNGNWSVPSNWMYNIVPPNPLPSGSTINIASAPGDSCVLNFQQTIPQGASLIISTGANLVLSDSITINTFSVTELPVIKTTPIINISSSNASVSGIVSSEGESAVTERGLVWSTASGPTTADSKTINGAGTGSFTGNLTDLLPDTWYYVRAYATNTSGTAYGDEIYFKTLPLPL